MTSLTTLFTSLDKDNDPLKNSLIDLWKKIEKKQKRNQKFLHDKDQLFSKFQAEILPVEQRQGEQVLALFEFLLPFISRKSLSHYQREELVEWQESILAFLSSHPFLTDINIDKLQHRLSAAIGTYIQSQDIEIDAQQIASVRTEIEHMFDGDMQLSDEDIMALLKDPSLLNQYIQRMQDELDEEYADESPDNEGQAKQKQDYQDPFSDFCEEGFEEDDVQSHSSQDAKQRNLDKLFKAGQLNKIYKRLASLLHPDKEQDPLKKEQKHLLMQTLSEARKNKDAFTLLQLYQTHINDGEFGFDTETLTSMQALLREKLHRLDDELHLEKSSNELSTLVWRKFSGRSKKQTQNNFRNHIEELEGDVYAKQSIMQQHQTVAKMKKLLQARIEDSRVWQSNMPIDLADLFR